MTFGGQITDEVRWAPLVPQAPSRAAPPGQAVKFLKGTSDSGLPQATRLPSRPFAQGAPACARHALTGRLSLSSRHGSEFQQAP